MNDLPRFADIFAQHAGEQRVQVLLPLPLGRPYDYLAPARVRLSPGQFVRVPFGSQTVQGVVWPYGEAGESVDPAKLKRIEQAFDTPALAPDVLDFIAWASSYVMAPPGAILRLVMRAGEALSPPSGMRLLTAGDVDGRTTQKRARVLDLAAREARTPGALAAAAGVGVGVVRALVTTGALKEVLVDPDPPFARPDLARAGALLSTEQSDAVAFLARAFDVDAPAPVLLDGVTGSGKTEVYLEAVGAALRREDDAQALILLPEIALTAPFLQRLEERFGAAPAAWHSDMSAAARRRVWRRTLDGSARLVVGARSALFLPFRRLRIIIVDEEHDGAYKQEDGVVYHARDLAVARARRAGIPIILASATPSLESVVNVDQGRYDLARLSRRYGKAQLPAIALVDMRAAPPEPGRWLSPALVDGVEEAVSAGGQALLFLNRRGYAPLTVCKRCGHRMKAPDSDTWLVEHRFENRLVCHHTGFSMPKPPACPACHAVGGLSACGPGIERVAEEAAERWPLARRQALSSDAAGPAQLRAALDAMRDGAIDILIATQIVAKGHTFPGLTFVGVVDADLGLAGGDLRAAERTFQLLSQVAGRAGRVERAGRALLQTYQPDSPVMRALAEGDRDAFLAAEAQSRRAMGFPPYGRLAAVILKSKNEAALQDSALAHRRAAPRAGGADLWGPAPAPIYRLRGEARMRFLLRAKRDFNVQAYIAAWLSSVKPPAAVRRFVDIDPYSFL